MSALPQPETRETNVQEIPLAGLSDDSLPAAQALEAQEKDAEPNPAPRFIP